MNKNVNESNWGVESPSFNDPQFLSTLKSCELRFVSVLVRSVEPLRILKSRGEM
jgi:hypothetical protein